MRVFRQVRFLAVYILAMFLINMLPPSVLAQKRSPPSVDLLHRRGGTELDWQGRERHRQSTELDWQGREPPSNGLAGSYRDDNNAPPRSEAKTPVHLTPESNKIKSSLLEAIFTPEQVTEEEKSFPPPSVVLEKTQGDYRILLLSAQGYEQRQVGTYPDTVDTLAALLGAVKGPEHVHIRLEGFKAAEFDAFISTLSVSKAKQNWDISTTFLSVDSNFSGIDNRRFDFKKVNQDSARLVSDGVNERIEIDVPEFDKEGKFGKFDIMFRTTEGLKPEQRENIFRRIYEAVIRYFSLSGDQPSIAEIAAADLAGIVRKELRELKAEGLLIDGTLIWVRFREEASDIYMGQKEIDNDDTRRAFVLLDPSLPR